MTAPSSNEASRIVWHDLMTVDLVTGPEIVYGIGKYAVARENTQGTFGLFKPAG